MNSKEYRVIIAGSRHFNNYYLLRNYADKLLERKKEDYNIIIMSGHCYGTDLLGERYAVERKYGLEIYPAEWSRYGKRAGPLRNAQMAEAADALIAMWDGESRGTKSMIELAKEKGLAVRVKLYEKAAK